MSIWVKIRDSVTGFAKDYLKPALLSGLASLAAGKIIKKDDK